MPELLGGKCPICGEAATADLAPNPGPNVGGGSAPKFPDPPGVTMPVPVAESVPTSRFFLVLCTNPAHRTLVSGAALEEMGFTPPVPPSARTVPETKETKGHGKAAHEPPAHAKPAHDTGAKK